MKLRISRLALAFALLVPAVTGCARETDDAEDGSLAMTGSPGAALDAEKVERARALRALVHTAYRDEGTTTADFTESDFFRCAVEGAPPPSRAFAWDVESAELRGALERAGFKRYLLVHEYPTAAGVDLSFVGLESYLDPCRGDRVELLRCKDVRNGEGPTRAQCGL